MHWQSIIIEQMVWADTLGPAIKSTIKIEFSVILLSLSLIAKVAFPSFLHELLFNTVVLIMVAIIVTSWKTIIS